MLTENMHAGWTVAHSCIQQTVVHPRSCHIDMTFLFSKAIITGDAGQPKVQIMAGTRDFSLPQNVQTSSDPPSPCLMGNRLPF